MHLFILFTTLLVISLSNIKNYLQRGGCDERIKLTYDEDKKMIGLIKNENNLNLLKKIQSNVSIQEKLDFIEKNDFTSSYKIFDIKAGNLMNDWEFEEFS